MPMNPEPGESQQEFMSRCIEHEMGKGHPQDQAIAMCYSMSGEGKSVLEAITKKAEPPKIDEKSAATSTRKPLPVVKLR